MSLSLDEVARIARLAHLEISPAEAAQLHDRLNDILGLVAQLQAVDTAGVEPMAHALDAVQRLREDRVSESDQRASFQAIAPETDAGLYLVPRVIE